MRELGAVGIWSRRLRYGDPSQTSEAAAELEELGYGTLWIPDIGGPVLEAADRLLGATDRIVVATGVINIWMHDAAEIARGHADLDRRYPARFLLGLGIGHAHEDVSKVLPPADQKRLQLDLAALVAAQERGSYRRPLSTMRAYLDALDAGTPQGARPARVLAALGPRMIELGGERTLGVHPYMVPAEHTARAREALGSDRLVAPELSVILDSDPERARGLARVDVAGHFGLPNYVNCWEGLGFGAADLADGGSDRLIDALYAWGTLEQIAARIREHREAGADHVCLRVVRDDPDRLPLREWRQLAGAVVGS